MWTRSSLSAHAALVLVTVASKPWWSGTFLSGPARATRVTARHGTPYGALNHGRLEVTRQAGRRPACRCRVLIVLSTGPKPGPRHMPRRTVGDPRTQRRDSSGATDPGRAART